MLEVSSINQLKDAIREGDGDRINQVLEVSSINQLRRSFFDFLEWL